MERSQRIGLIAAALVVAVAAFLILKDGDDESSDKDKTAQTTAAETIGSSAPAPAPPPVPTIKIKDGKPVGGVQDLEVDKGDTLQFRVTSDADHEIHLHGYDIEKDVEAGGQISYELKAGIDGIFEIEVEDLKEQIAELRVNP